MKGGRGRGGMPMRDGMMGRGGLMGLRWLIPIPIAVIFFLFMMMSGRGIQSPMFIVIIALVVLGLIGGGVTMMQRRDEIDSDEKQKNSYDNKIID